MDDLELELEAARKKAIDKRAAKKAELDAAEASKPEAAEEYDPAKVLRDAIMEIIEDNDNPPSEEDINGWRDFYGKGNVHMTGFGPGHAYIFKPLTLGTWKKINEYASLQQEAGAENVGAMMKEKAVRHCLLWPATLDKNFFDKSHAGVLDNLYEVIMYNSYMLSPQEARAITIQL